MQSHQARRRRAPGLVPALAMTVGLAGLATAAVSPASADDPSPTARAGGKLFQRAATYPVFQNLPEGVDPTSETVAEISAVTEDGRTMAYTDAPGKRVGFLDISKPGKPVGTGSIDLTEVGDADDQPTSVAIDGDHLLVVVDTSGGDLAQPSGRLDVFDLGDRERITSIDLGGQPDSIAISADHRYAAIAMENQRDEDATPEGGEEGDLPQPPAGFVNVVELDGEPDAWQADAIALTGQDGSALPMMADAGLDTPEDPEPEYVSINADNQLAVTLQENNGVAVIDLSTQQLTSVFSAGNAQVSGIDTDDDGAYDPTGSIDLPREPDAVGWIDETHLATANEGDWKGGTRGWTVFDATTGKVVWDAGNSFERLATRYGLHNEGRAGKKGPEPEGLAVATIGGKRRAFVGSERSNFVAVYDVTDPAKPRFEQVLATTNGPEGLLAVPSRNLFLVSSETDEADKGVRASVGVYQYGKAVTPRKGTPGPRFPTVTTNPRNPIGWGALSSLAADQKRANVVYATSDAAYSTGRIYTLKGAAAPYRITDVLEVTDSSGETPELDLEGLATRARGGFWAANEGATGAENALLAVSPQGRIQRTVPLPRRITDHVGKWGLEGVTSIGRGKKESVYVALQRPLFTDPSDPEAGTEDGDRIVRIGRYRPATQKWSWFGYRLSRTQTPGDWVGLSEIVAVDRDTLAVVERDKLNGPAAAVKRIYSFDVPKKGAGLTTVRKRLAVDLLPALRSTRGWTQEKVEGMTIDAAGRVRVVTDNDGLDDATGETVMFEVGKARKIFGR